ncbi:probable serine/threonine-protein kinase cdc7 [Drosophila montana]|uniref:probable serine/threonine-protein kinase cdc7 n=1 Tax=Drosophila montana TaxID=40370 RepID=UPI00313F24ED
MTDIGADCPHRQQLEHTLLHCQTQSEILQATRDNYLSIIEEFQRDLEELTEQVQQQQIQQQQQQQQNDFTSKESEQSYYEELTRIGANELELQVGNYNYKNISNNLGNYELHKYIHTYL